jgi:uncharacterized protein YecT (DUF1311 family)
MNKIICLGFFLVLPLSISGQQQTVGESCLEKAASQTEMNICAAEDFRRADTELNLVYQQLLQKYSGDKVLVQKLRLAEEAWIKFREAQAAALYGERDQFSGSVYPMCRAMGMTRLTMERVEDLKRMLNPREGDVCAF